MRKRRTSREVALRALFQVDVGGMTPSEALGLATESGYGDEVLTSLRESLVRSGEEPARIDEVMAEVVAFARRLVEGSGKHAARIDEVIERYARGWTLARMANVDRNILRLAVFELLYLPDVPPSVAVDEAVELAKKYSTAESGRFVNGILGNLVRNLEAERAEVKDA